MSIELASVWGRTRSITRGAWIALSLCACGQASDAANTTAPVSDAASAYLALSASVQACQDEQDACVSAAAGDAAQIADCDTAAQGCMDKTRGAQDQARARLRDDAEGCVRECRRHHRDDADGGVDESAAPADGAGAAEMGSTRGCMAPRAPAEAGACMDDFFTCLDATGVRASSAQTELDEATREAIRACVETAHGCMMSQMMSRRGPRADDHGHHPVGGAAGAPAREPRGPGGAAGTGADADGAGRHSFERRGAAGAAPMHHGRFGAGGAAGG